MESGLTYEAALAALIWQVELGADEAILDAPVNRFDLPDRQPQGAAAKGRIAADRRQAAEMTPDPPAPVDVAALAQAQAAQAGDLAALAAAMQAAPSPLSAVARQFVFADGLPSARVMVVGDAPGREEDLQGRPFVGAAGRLLDLMLAAIGLGRDSPDPAHAVYITNVLPWRPPGNRTPEPAEIAQFAPFLQRHIQLADPGFLVLLGNTPCQALLGRGGITRNRGQWAEVLGRPALPTFHPSDLLRTPEAKGAVWADLLALKARLAP